MSRHSSDSRFLLGMAFALLILSIWDDSVQIDIAFWGCLILSELAKKPRR